MLLEKPIVKGSVITIKLTSGEELLARFESESETQLIVEKAATIAQGQQGMGIVPWMMTSQAATVKLNKTAVVAYTQTEEEIAKAYTETTTSLKLA